MIHSTTVASEVDTVGYPNGGIRCVKVTAVFSRRDIIRAFFPFLGVPVTEGKQDELAPHHVIASVKARRLILRLNELNTNIYEQVLE